MIFTLKNRAIVLLITLAFIKPGTAAYSKEVNMEFKVNIPTTTPQDAKIYIVGNIEELGNWDPSNIQMKKLDEIQYGIKIRVEKDTKIEYKYTRGSWKTVEKTNDFSEIENRKAIAGEDEKINDAVSNWANERSIKKEHTLTGDIRYHKDIYSEEMDNSRDIIVYLPPGYEEDKEKR